MGSHGGYSAVDSPNRFHNRNNNFESIKPPITNQLTDPLKYERNRKDTFPKGNPKIPDQLANLLASHGFYYSHQKIQCFACGIRLDIPYDLLAKKNGITEGQILDAYHKRALGNCACPFFEEDHAENVQSTTNTEQQQHPVSSSTTNKSNVPSTSSNSNNNTQSNQQSSSNSNTTPRSEVGGTVTNTNRNTSVDLTSGGENIHCDSPSRAVSINNENRSANELINSRNNSGAGTSYDTAGGVTRTINPVSPISNSSGSAVLDVTSRMFLAPTHMRRMENGGSYIRPARDFERLKSERERLATFSIAPGWPVSFISPEDCATAGFFFLGDGDKVQCAFCRGVAGEWEVGDQPISEHRRHFPRCPFVCNLPVGNVPIGQEEEIALQRQRDEMLGIDVCGPFAPVIRSASGSTEPETSTVRGAQPLNGNMDDLVGLGIKACGNGPVHTNLVTQSARIKTFSNWPSSTGQSAEAMADAGFFYMGMLDHIKCFYCDGGLRNWEPSDDPWREHARWFPNCTFVLLNKGNEFIKKVNEDKPPVIPQQYLLKQAGVSREPRRVSDQELRDLIDTPIVQAALEMGMEVGKVKGALQRKIQQTGQPFLTTESLLEAILGRNYEYESDPDSDIDDNEEEERLTIRRPPAISTVGAGHRAAFSAQESSSAEASSSSAEHSSGSGDEDMPSDANETVVKTPANRLPSSDSGIASISNGSASEEDHQEDVPARNKGGDMELEEEVRQLREARQCKICMDNEVGVVFLPCGHLVSCVRCATAVSVCAVCRAQIKAHVRTYFS